MARFSTPFQFIRKIVFGFETQHEFAVAFGCEQATVSRYENGVRRLTSDGQARIREMARERGLKWDNNWFFEVPTEYLGRRIDGSAPDNGVSATEAA